MSQTGYKNKRTQQYNAKRSKRLRSVNSLFSQTFFRALHQDSNNKSKGYKYAYCIVLSRSDVLPDLDAPERGALGADGGSRHRREHELVDGDGGEALLELGEGLAAEAAEHLQALQPRVVREGQVRHGQDLVAPRGAKEPTEEWF